MPSSLRQCATPCHHNHIHSPHTHTGTLIFYIHAHLKREGDTGVEGKREEERGERRGQYSRVQSVDDDCVRLFRSDASVSAWSHSSFSFSSAFCIPPSAQRYTLVLPASYPPAAHGVDGHAGRGPVDGDWPVACGSEWPQ